MSKNLTTSKLDRQNILNNEKALDEIQAKYGKNSILKSTSLLSNSTIKERNKKIGGHHE